MAVSYYILRRKGKANNRTRKRDIFCSMFLLFFSLLTCPAHAIKVVNGIYNIETAQELADFAALIDEGETAPHAILTADIDFRDYPTIMLGNTRERPFQGIFDGNGHIVTLGINTTAIGDYSAAFFRFAYNATIRNLRLEGNISSCGKHCASLISYASGSCTIINVVSSVTLSSSSYDDCMGGFIGIAGENFDRVGTTVTFINCAFFGSIIYTGENITGVNSIGRFAHHGGGFVGWKGILNSRVYLINCYSAPRELQHSTNFYPFVRYWPYKDIGFVFLRSCYYASNITDYGQSTIPNLSQGHPLSLDNFENGRLCALLNVGSSSPLWHQHNGKDRFPLPTFVDPTLTNGGMYWISNAVELEEFARLVNTTNPYAQAILSTDIDYRGHHVQIGSCERPFLGIFDGNDHQIQIDFSEGPVKALFGCVGYESIIKNLQVNGKISVAEEPVESSSTAAGIAAYLKGGFIAGCLSTVDIDLKSTEPAIAGGIVGEGCDMAVISNCVFSGSISASHHHTAGYVMGKAAEPASSPTVLIRNSIAFLPSGTLNANTLLPLYGGVKQHTHASETFYLSKEDFYHTPLNGPDIHQLSSGKIFQIIWDRQIINDRETINEQQFHIKKTNFILIFGGLITLLIIFSLIAMIQSHKAKQLDLQRRFNDAMRRLDVWERTLVQAREEMGSDVALVTEADPDIPADSSQQSENSRFKTLYDRLLLLMDKQKLYCMEGLNEVILSRELGTNVKYLALCIKQCSNQSNFNTWLATYRINHALSLISANPLIDVKTLCHDSGFSSYSSFNRHFKNIVGMTAQQYLKLMRSSTSSSL